MNGLPESWLVHLQNEIDAPYMQELQAFLEHEKASGKVIYPKEEAWFSALIHTSLEKVRVVILGQDPYHGQGQAHGLSFSVGKDVRPPPSLKNIFKELNDDLGFAPTAHGNLLAWAEQGVLLLNSVLTVEAGLAASHKKRGWERFTDTLIALVNAKTEPVVFILWGNYAQRKAQFVDGAHHLILRSAHPSPLSAHNGFFGSKPFSKANSFLREHGQVEIDWRLAN